MIDQESPIDSDEPVDLSDADFQAALDEVLRRHGPAFKALADYDAGRE